jgi:hypothetical protein
VRRTARSRRIVGRSNTARAAWQFSCLHGRGRVHRRGDRRPRGTPRRQASSWWSRGQAKATARPAAEPEKASATRPSRPTVRPRGGTNTTHPEVGAAV